MPANSRWDLIRGLKGQQNVATTLPDKEINSVDLFEGI